MASENINARKDKAQTTDRSGQTVSEVEGQAKAPLYTVMSLEKFQKCENWFAHHGELLHSLSRSIRYCKAEAYRDCVLGTMRIPRKREGKDPALTFAYYLTEQSIVFIEYEGSLKSWLEKHAETLPESGTPAQMFVSILKQITDDDLLYLLHIESEIEQMEEEIEEGTAGDFFSTLTKRRQKLSELNAYYMQLRGIGEIFQSDICQPIISNGQEWDRFIQRAERLQSHVQLLRENLMQLRELFQSVQDAQRNRIMGIITIITTIFFPLSLLAGWYGMNFVNMPELKWEYSYPLLIAAVIVIVTAEIIYFKKKKFF